MNNIKVQFICAVIIFTVFVSVMLLLFVSLIKGYGVSLQSVDDEDIVVSTETNDGSLWVSSDS